MPSRQLADPPASALANRWPHVVLVIDRGTAPHSRAHIACGRASRVECPRSPVQCTFTAIVPRLPASFCRCVSEACECGSPARKVLRRSPRVKIGAWARVGHRALGERPWSKVSGLRGCAWKAGYSPTGLFNYLPDKACVVRFRARRAPTALLRVCSVPCGVRSSVSRSLCVCSTKFVLDARLTVSCFSRHT